MEKLTFLQFAKAVPQNMSVAHLLEWFEHYEEHFDDLVAYQEFSSCMPGNIPQVEKFKFASELSKFMWWPLQICVLYTEIHFVKI